MPYSLVLDPWGCLLPTIHLWVGLFPAVYGLDEEQGDTCISRPSIRLIVALHGCSLLTSSRSSPVIIELSPPSPPRLIEAIESQAVLTMRGNKWLHR